MNTSPSRSVLIGFVIVQLLGSSMIAYTKKSRKKTTELSFADVAIPMTIAGAVLGLYGATCLYGDVQQRIYHKDTYRLSLVQNAQLINDECYDRYNAMIQIMYDVGLLPIIRHNDNDSFSVTLSRYTTADISELTLYQLASNKHDQIDTYCTQLQRDIARVYNSKKHVAYRIHALQDKREYGIGLSFAEEEEARSLGFLSRSLEQLFSNLNTLNGHLEYHHAYFVLYDAEDRMWKWYPDELFALYNKDYTYDSLVDYLYTIVRMKHMTSYSYNTYLSQITQDISFLQNRIYAMPSCYVDRLGAAHELHNQLEFLYGVLLAHQQTWGFYSDGCGI